MGTNLPKKGSPKRVFPVSNIKWTPPLDSAYSNQSLNHSLWTIFNFWTKFAQEGYLRSKTERDNIIIEFCIFELVLVPNFNFDWQFWFFEPNLPKNGFSGLKQKSEHYYWVLHIQMSLGTKFNSNRQNLFFRPNLPKKGISGRKEKMWTSAWNSAYSK